MKHTTTLLLALLCSFAAAPSTALADSTSTWHIGGTIDTYFMYDLNKPTDGNRQYATSPVRHNEFAVNLALVNVTYTTTDIRARVALQAGTYVESNYAAEPGLLRNIHAAMAGVRICNGLWLDAGIMPSHIGYESAISSDNLNYTRSLMAEYTPYYESGLKLTWDFAENASLAGFVLNGWQNIRETNSDKALGTQLTIKPSSEWLLNWSSFVGNEMPDSVASALRVFNDFYATYTTENFTIAAILDIGIQNMPSETASWYAASLQAKVPLSSVVAINGRIETYMDKNNIIVATPTALPFEVMGGSVGVDIAPTSYALVRFEARMLTSSERIYMKNAIAEKGDVFLTAAMAINIP